MQSRGYGPPLTVMPLTGTDQHPIFYETLDSSPLHEIPPARHKHISDVIRMTEQIVVGCCSTDMDNVPVVTRERRQ